MSTQYVLSGSNVFVSNDADMNVAKKLPVGTYTVNLSPDRGFFLTRTPDFTVPSKLYGDTTSMAARFLDTFYQRPGTTGVLLLGTKGSGKSLAMKKTSLEGLKRNISTLIVSSAFCGSGFNQFIQSIEEECLVIFDEFEKLYTAEQQEQLLTLLDGVFSTKKLVIMTANDSNKIDKHMINRPGRLFYNLTYKGLTKEFIVEYCEDNLNDKNKIDHICSVAALTGEFNFDMLQALVEELNRYNESVKDVLKVLNVKINGNVISTYDVQLFVDGVELKKDKFGPVTVRNPLSMDDLFFEIYQGVDEDDIEITIPTSGDKIKIKSDLSRIEAWHENYRILLLKPEPKEYNYHGLF